MKRSLAILLAGCVGLQGCVLTAQQMAEQRGSLDMRQLCGQMVLALRARDDAKLRAGQPELDRRGITLGQCVARVEAIERQGREAGQALAAVAIVGAAATAPRSTFSPGLPPDGLDFEWAWDQFNNNLGIAIWRCRGVQTGQFWDDAKCPGPKIDSRWPGLTYTPR